MLRSTSWVLRVDVTRSECSRHASLTWFFLCAQRLQVDPIAWKLEVERMAPKLRVAVAPDMRDWRQHLDAAHTHMGTMAAAWPDVR